MPDRFSSATAPAPAPAGTLSKNTAGTPMSS